MRALLRLTRFPLVFTAVADSAAGYLLARAPRPVEWRVLVLVPLASALLYACGMVFNDVFDHRRDKERHPERPIPSGLVSVQAAKRFGLALFVIGAVLAAIAHFAAGVAAFAVFVAIVLYNGALKERGILGAISMGSVRFLNFAMGIVAGGLAPSQLIGIPPGPWAQAGILAGYIAFLTAMSQIEEKPSRGRTLVCALLMLTAPAGSWALAAKKLPYAAVTAGALTLVILLTAGAAAIRPSKDSLMRAVLWGVVGVILLDATFVFGAGPVEGGGAVAALVLPVLIARPAFKHL